jgi:hypothetical protein
MKLIPFAALCGLLLLFAFCIQTALASSEDAPDYQSVSGEFAQSWIKDFKEENGLASPAIVQKQIANKEDESDENDSDLWSWGNAPRGSKIVDGQLVRDPNYLRALLNLTDNWLDESYTDSATGLPVNVYSDPLTGRKYYDVLNPKTGKLLFAYYTYEDEGTGQLVYVYTDPDTGEEVHASSVPIDVIESLASGNSVYTF